MFSILKPGVVTAALACVKALSGGGIVQLSELPNRGARARHTVSTIYEINKGHKMPALMAQQMLLAPENVFLAKKNSTKSTLVQLLCFFWFGGEPNRELLDVALQRARHTDTLLYPPKWRGFLIDELERRKIAFQLGHRHAVSYDDLDPKHLQSIVDSLPSNYNLKPINVDLAKELFGSDYFQSGWHVTPFNSVENFTQRGFGYVLYEGDTLIAAASTAATFEDEMEVQVDVHIDHREKGLAKFVSAQLVIESLRRGLNPHWDAVSEPSRRIALKLGYQDEGSYEVIYIGEPPKQ